MILSYSFIRDFINCPRQCYHKQVAKDLPFVETEELKWGNRVHKAFEDAINKNQSLPEDMPYAGFLSVIKGLPKDHIAAEIKLAATADGRPTDFFAKDVAFRGKVDVLVERGEEGVIPDWKTGKVHEDPLELKVQGWLVRVNKPYLKSLKGFYVWLKEKRKGKDYDLIDNSTEKWLYEKRKEIMSEKEWRPKPSGLCGWCSVKSCEFNPHK